MGGFVWFGIDWLIRGNHLGRSASDPKEVHMQIPRLTTLTALTAVGVFALAGCSSGSNATDSLATMSSSASPELVESTDDTVEVVGEAAQQLAVSTPLPAFSTTTLAGADFTQETIQGSATVLWFWAPWCSVCRAEAPDVSEAAAELAGSVDLVGVAALGSKADMQTFVADTGIDNFTQLFDPDAEVWGLFGVASQPAFAFISSDGSIDVVQGSLDREEILERAQALQ